MTINTWKDVDHAVVHSQISLQTAVDRYKHYKQKVFGDNRFVVFNTPPTRDEQLYTAYFTYLHPQFRTS